MTQTEQIEETEENPALEKEAEAIDKILFLCNKDKQLPLDEVKKMAENNPSEMAEGAYGLCFERSVGNIFYGGEIQSLERFSDANIEEPFYQTKSKSHRINYTDFPENEYGRLWYVYKTN
jgi:hypothetical protein